MDAVIIEQVRQTNAYACLECGKCTGVCPVSILNRQYSPRILLTRAVNHHFDSLFNDYDLWSCLTCKRCDEVCPSAVRYIALTQLIRSHARDAGFKGKCSHTGAVELLQRIMTTEDLNQNRLDWITPDLNTSSEGEFLYYVGCSPYFDVLFSDLELNTLDAARSSIRILNQLGITPALMPNERCCGHDLLWNGDTDNFNMLAGRNTEAIKATGAKTILFSCAECMSAVKNLYSEYGFKIEAELKHMSQFLAERIEAGELDLNDSAIDTTYQDPCRLGRHLGIYDEPRQVLRRNGTDHFHEMVQTRNGSLCCGVSAWMNCDTTSKAIQRRRLEQARATGAELLAVACPKCQIHLVCSMKDEIGSRNESIEIRDISTIAFERIVKS